MPRNKFQNKLRVESNQTRFGSANKTGWRVGLIPELGGYQPGNSSMFDSKLVTGIGQKFGHDIAKQALHLLLQHHRRAALFSGEQRRLPPVTRLHSGRWADSPVDGGDRLLKIGKGSRTFSQRCTPPGAGDGSKQQTAVPKWWWKKGGEALELLDSHECSGNGNVQTPGGLHTNNFHVTVGAIFRGKLYFATGKGLLPRKMAVAISHFSITVNHILKL